VIKSFINKSPVFVSDESSIDSAIREMANNKISSILIKNKSNEVVGIVTERDILRNLSTLDVDRKLSRPIRVIMNRPVKFVSKDNLISEIKALSLKQGVRHFPVVENLPSADQAIMSDEIVGILTTTDFFKFALTILND
jgi:CBS domain-containing protein